MRISARNQLRATVTEGAEVLAVIKASDVMIAADSG
jgi:molybdopterin-binding protein